MELAPFSRALFRAPFAAGLMAAAALTGTFVASVQLATPAAAASWSRVSATSACAANAVKEAPSVFWVRLRQAVYAHKDVPQSFWTDVTYRDDMARIACYESTFNDHADDPAGYYGWFQMNKPLIESEGVTFTQYWYGSHSEPCGWYQATAGERYVHSRYGNPAAAWSHETHYGWY